MSPTPLITVLMSVHNGRRFACEAIDSILAQTFRDFELIIIDDGSTDGVTADLKRYAETESRIHLIVQQNAGLTKSLNRGLASARGEYVARMDADDISDPRRLELQIEALIADPDLVIVGCEIERFTEDGIALGAKGQPLTHTDIRARLLKGDSSALIHPAVMFRRESALSIKGYDEAFETAQDFDFFLRMTEAGKAANLPQTLLWWRQHPQSVNRTKSATWAKVKTIAIENTIRRLGAELFAQQMFAAEGTFHFPSSSLDLGAFAWASGRRSEAVRLYFRALHSGPNRLAALRRLLLAAAENVVGVPSPRANRGEGRLPNTRRRFP